jgi:hypothetical protein
VAALSVVLVLLSGLAAADVVGAVLGAGVGGIAVLVVLLVRLATRRTVGWVEQRLQAACLR